METGPGPSVDECPECGGPMVKRINRKTDEPFYGCRRFPDCTGTLPISGARPSDVRPELPSDRYRRNDRRRWEQ